MRRLVMVTCLLVASCTGATHNATSLAAGVVSAHPFHDYPDPAPTTTVAPVVTTSTEAPTTAPARPKTTEASRGVPRNQPCGGWEAAVADTGDWSVPEVCTVMGCESTFNPGAINGRYKGLMQVDGGSLDGVTNLEQAFALWAETRTWRRWSCKP